MACLGSYGTTSAGFAYRPLAAHWWEAVRSESFDYFWHRSFYER